jgi:hypothetical protein
LGVPFFGEAQMVVMGHEDDGLVSQFWVTAGQEAENVGGFLLADIAGHVERKLDAQWYRLEVALFSRGAELVEVLAGKCD